MYKKISYSEHLWLKWEADKRYEIAKAFGCFARIDIAFLDRCRAHAKAYRGMLKGAY